MSDGNPDAYDGKPTVAEVVADTYSDFPLRVVTVVRSDRTRIDVDHPLLGRGIEYPSGTVIIEWYRDAYPEHNRLDHPHRSDYGSLSDVEQGTGGDVIVSGEI